MTKLEEKLIELGYMKIAECQYAKNIPYTYNLIKWIQLKNWNKKIDIYGIANDEEYDAYSSILFESHEEIDKIHRYLNDLEVEIKELRKYEPNI